MLLIKEAEMIQKNQLPKGKTIGSAGDTENAFKAGTAQAGVEIGANLDQVMKVVEADWTNMNWPMKLQIGSSITKAPSVGDVVNQTGSLAAWDIRQMFQTEMPGNDFFASGAAGKGLFQQFVTVHGEVHYAGAVNYILWGKVNRLLYEDLMNEKRKGNLFKKGDGWFLKDGKGIELPAFDPQLASPEQALTLTVYYRVLPRISKELMIASHGQWSVTAKTRTVAWIIP